MKKFLLILILFLVALIIFKVYQSHSELDKTKLLYQDSISMYQDKVGHLYNSLEIHQLAIKDLSDSLKKEANNHKNPIYITRTEIKVNTDTIIKLVTDTIIKNDSVYSIRSSYKDNYLKLNNTIVSRDSTSYTTLDSLSMNVNIYNDIILKDDKYYSIVRTDNPYCKIINSEAAFIQGKINKQRKFGLTLGVGYGINYHGQCYPYLGIMFGYRLF